MRRPTSAHTTRSGLGLPPQNERRHFVFLDPCGCPYGLTEWRPHRARFKGVTTEDEAWDDMFDTRAEEREARRRGVRVKLVDHATYEQKYYPLMRKRCTHGGS